MQLGELPFGSNIKIPERREGGTYELADYTLGCLNNFDVGTAGLIRKDIHSLCRFGDSVEYAGSDLDKRMAEIYDSYPDEFKELIIPSTIPLYNGSGPEDITRKVFAPTLTMVGGGENEGVDEGFTWPIFTGRNSRERPLTARLISGGFLRSSPLTSRGSSARAAPPTTSASRRSRLVLSPLLQSSNRYRLTTHRIMTAATD